MESWRPVGKKVCKQNSRIMFRVNTEVDKMRDVKFYGPTISVGELKTLITEDLFPGAEKSESVIVLQNIDTKKVFDREGELIPANSTILVSQNPIQKICGSQFNGDMSYEDGLLYKFQKRLQQPVPRVPFQEIHNCSVQVGEGGFGTVFMVKWRGSIHAMKVMEKRRVEKTKVLMEIKLLNALQHPMIVSLQFLTEHHGHIYLGMELAAGGDLVDLLDDKGPFCEPDARHYTAQIVLALEYLHQVQVLHRDIKPANLLVMEDGYLKLCDFGQAKRSSSSSGAVGWAGTEAFAAPEVTGGGRHSPAMDIWSLGAVLYHMMTLINPDNIASHIDLHGLDDRFSASLRALLTGMFQYEPSARPSSKEIRDGQWLEPVDLDKVFYKELRAPFLPSVVWECDIDDEDSGSSLSS